MKNIVILLIIFVSTSLCAQEAAFIKTGVGISNFNEVEAQNFIVGQQIGLQVNDLISDNLNITIGINWKRKGFNDRENKAALAINFVNCELGMELLLPANLRVGLGGYFGANVSTTAIIGGVRIPDKGINRIYTSQPGGFFSISYLKDKAGFSLQFDKGFGSLAVQPFEAHTYGIFFTLLYRIYQ